MKVESACRAVPFSVRLCFLVNVLNARGRNVGGGSSIGKIGAVAAGLKAGCASGRRDAGIIGCTGVPNAGDEEKTFVSFCFRIESIVVSMCGLVFLLFGMVGKVACCKLRTRRVEARATT
jgi:hypothetical protein